MRRGSVCVLSILYLAFLCAPGTAPAVVTPGLAVYSAPPVYVYERPRVVYARPRVVYYRPLHHCRRAHGAWICA